MKRAPFLIIGLSWICASLAFADKKPLIQIGVEVVEVDDKKAQKLGMNWMESMKIGEITSPAVYEVDTLVRDGLFATLNALMQHDVANLLANPKLVTRDGSTAAFHAGGELPYATSGTLGSVQIEFKSYGVDLKINPHLEPTGEITLDLDAEVSGPDDQHSVMLSGNSVQGIRSRKINSQLTLKPGSTLTLAGLIQTDVATTRKGIPGLMDIPILGHLFSLNVKTNEKTSIVVFVTPIVLDENAAQPSAPNHES